MVTLALSPAAAAQSPKPPEDKLQKATEDVREAGTKLTQIAVPMSLEPAFTFKP